MAKNRRLNLSVPKSCKDWFEAYAAYLGIASRKVELGDRAVKGKASLLRHLCYRYSQYLRWNFPVDTPTPAQESLQIEEPFADIPCYLSRDAEELWNGLIREGFILNYSQLATYAIWYAWEHNHKQVARIRQRSLFWQNATTEDILRKVNVSN